MAKKQQRLARVLRELAVELGSQAEIAKRSGISRASVCRISRGDLPTAKTLDRLREAFAERIPDVETESDCRSARALALLAKHGDKARTPTARAKQAKKQRGQSRPAQSVAMRKYHASRSDRPHCEHLTQLVQSAEGRARISLGKFLHSAPKPSQAQLDEWATVTADRLGIAVADVETIWRPVLQDRGLKSRRGRHPFDDRRELVESLMREWPRTQSGRLAAGFWPHAARRVREDEPCSISAEDLRTWYRDHVRAAARPSPSLHRRRARTQVRAEQRAAERAQRLAAKQEEFRRLVSIGEAAGILGVDRSTVREWEEAGRLPTSGSGSRRFLREAITELKDELEPRRCTATRADGRRCRALARPSDEAGRCKAHARTPAACGTISGYNAHRDRGELPCQACRAANTAYYRDLRERRQRGDRTDRRHAA